MICWCEIEKYLQMETALVCRHRDALTSPQRPLIAGGMGVLNWNNSHIIIQLRVIEIITEELKTIITIQEKHSHLWSNYDQGGILSNNVGLFLLDFTIANEIVWFKRQLE